MGAASIRHSLRPLAFEGQLPARPGRLRAAGMRSCGVAIISGDDENTAQRRCAQSVDRPSAVNQLTVLKFLKKHENPAIPTCVLT